MKRFILPIVFVLVGIVFLFQLMLFGKYMDRDPSTHPTGLQMCDSRGENCSQGTYKDDRPLWLVVYSGFVLVGTVAGIVMIPSGVAIGIYRLATFKRVTPIKPTKAKK